MAWINYPYPLVQNHCAAGEIPATGAAEDVEVGIVPVAGVDKYGQLIVLDPPFTQPKAFTAPGQFLSS